MSPLKHICANGAACLKDNRGFAPFDQMGGSGETDGTGTDDGDG
jgi:hypothetical protein